MFYSGIHLTACSAGARVNGVTESSDKPFHCPGQVRADKRDFAPLSPGLRIRGMKNVDPVQNQLTSSSKEGVFHLNFRDQVGAVRNFMVSSALTQSFS